MFINKSSFTKNDIIIYLVILLLIERKVDSNLIKNKFNLSNNTFYRYISSIKNVLFEFGFYYVDVYYDSTLKLYICSVN